MKNENKKANYAIGLLLAVTLVLLAWGFASCKTKYIPVVEEHTRDSLVYINKTDTFYQHTFDSIRIQLPCSDSIEVAYVERWHTDTIREKSVRVDTISVERVDKEPQIVEVEKEVYKNDPFAKFCIWWFVLSIGYLAIKIYLKTILKR